MILCLVGALSRMLVVQKQYFYSQIHELASKVGKERHIVTTLCLAGEIVINRDGTEAISPPQGQ
jgi:hypothetical protein